MHVDPLNPLWRILDFVMKPLMYLLSGTLQEKPQESHFWHGQDLPQDSIVSLDMSLAVTTLGDEPAGRLHGGIAFHIPILGGWRNYIVLEMQKTDCHEWHVGWIVRLRKDNQITRFQLHRLPIFNTQIRLLSGTEEYSITFFAVDTNGMQLPLKFVGKGQIGDNEYPYIRLF